MSFEEKYLSIKNVVGREFKVFDELFLNSVTSSAKLSESLKEFAIAPSKRLRILLPFLYLKALGKEISQKNYELMCAVELIHTASLIHDDVIDNSDTRRGINTLNVKFDNNLAVIAGDFLLAAALKKISNLESFSILNLFVQTLEGMCLGETEQYFEKFKLPSLENYIEKSKLKTANLFKVALSAALELEGEDDNNAEIFAENFGIAFQIRDDLINFQTKKTDLKDGIYTAPQILGEASKNIQGGIEKTEHLIDNYFNKALAALKPLAESEYKRALIELVGIFQDV